MSDASSAAVPPPVDATPSAAVGTPPAVAPPPGGWVSPAQARAIGAQWPAPPVRLPPPDWWLAVVPPRPATPSRWVLLAAAVCGLLSALLFEGGIAANLLIIATAAAVAAALGARAAGRRPRPWTLLWAAGALAMLVIPVLSDAGWPSALAVIASIALASLALHGGRGWTGVLFSPFGILWQLGPSLPWAARAMKTQAMPDRQRWLPVVKASLVALVLLLVFGTLFATADPAFADLLSTVTPTVSVGDTPLRFLLFACGALAALAAARTATAPWRWDRYPVKPAKPRGRLEWALPMVVLNILFGTFVALQLAEWFRDYQAMIRNTSMTYAENARQGFWQLLWVTLLTLAVVAVAQRWAPRTGARDRLLTVILLGTLCTLTLGVVASAITRMWRYVDAYGLTRLRVWVVGVELWLGALFVLVMVAGALGRARWLPRAVALSGALAVLAYGLVSPDALVAEQNVARYEKTGKIDLSYVRDLSADAVPALDRLPAGLRRCALVNIQFNLEASPPPWYATSLSVARARHLLAARPADGELFCLSD